MISVIVPVYNTEKLLGKCIESVLKQTYTNFELILIDDGSSDTSGVICDSYAYEDERIKVIHIENSGVSLARNTGLQSAIGDFIAFLDSDDYLEPDFLEHAIKNITNADVYISGITMYGGNGSCQYIPKFYGNITIKNLYESIFFTIPQICVSGPFCKMFKKKIITENSIWFDPKLRCGEDTDFNLSYMRYAKSAYIENKSYYNYYRGNSNSLYSSYNPQYYADHVHVYDKWLNFINDIQCGQASIHYFKQVYVRALIGNLHTAFLHNMSKEEKKTVIRILSKDKMICSKIKIKGKDSVIKELLKHGCNHIVYTIFHLHYRGLSKKNGEQEKNGI